MADVRVSQENGMHNSKKRREVTSGTSSDPSSSVKRIKLEDEEPQPNPNTIEAVRGKNKELFLDLQEKNRRIQFLTKKCETLYQRRAITNSAFRCIQRQWIQLLDDLHGLVGAVATGSDDDDEDGTWWESLMETTESLGVLRITPENVKLELPEWFLAISRGDKEVPLPVPSAVKSAVKTNNEEQDESDDDTIPIGVSLTSKEKVVEANLKEQQQRVKDFVQTLVRSAMATSAERKAEMKQLIAEKRDATARLLALKDELASCKQKMTELQQDLEYKETERHRSCREYDRLREYLERTKENSSEAKADEDGKPSSGDMAEKSALVNGESKEDRSSTTSDSRSSSASEQEVKKLKSDISILVHKLQTERKTTESLRSEKEELTAEKVAWQREEAELRQAHEDKMTRFQEENQHLNEELVRLRHKVKEIDQHVDEKSKKRMEKLQEEMAKTKKHVDDVTVKNAALREKLSTFSGYRDQLADLKGEHESIKREVANLREQCEREKQKAARAQHTADHKEIATLTEKVKLLETQNGELRRALDDMRRVDKGRGDEKVATALERENECRSRYELVQKELAEAKADAAKLRLEIDEHAANQAAFKDENDALVAEIETINKDVESARHSKKKVIQQLEEKRSSAKKLQSQLAKESDAKAHCFEELAAARLQISSLNYVHKQQKAALEAAMETLQARGTELDQLKAYVKTLEKERDAVVTEKIKVQHEADVAKHMYNTEASQKQQQLLQDKSRPCERCEGYRRKESEYEKKLAAAKAAAATTGSSTGGSGLSDLERFELQDLQKQLKCSVCQDRHKDVIISKCYHMFCKECVDSNLRSRNRKCPTCKKMFGQDDVKNVWFT